MRTLAAARACATKSYTGLSIASPAELLQVRYEKLDVERIRVVPIKTPPLVMR